MSAAQPLPAGDYAVVELRGGRTYVGRVSLVDRLGARHMSIELLYEDALLPALLVSGEIVYHFSPITAEAARELQNSKRWQLPKTFLTMLGAPDAATGGAHV